ncbi:MAG TPA: phosphoribosyltransferase family protein [Ktedonobacteraceae bacterium]|jgi:putative phosphoribosyl transferase|nr:phosphoribosyltransferase family protein [Ktedonobacteraceae bacterium]
MIKQFRDRVEAGKLLAVRLASYSNRPDVLVLALPRGGVPVGYEIAHMLHAPLDVMIVRKLGVPGQEELAMGAIASGGVRVLNYDVVHTLGISEAVINEVAAREQRELERRERLYRENRPPCAIRGRIVMLVDDGIATGSTMQAALSVVKQQQPAHVIVAVPIAAAATCDNFVAQGDEVVCVLKPEMLYAIGVWYEQFAQTSDEEVRELLKHARQLHAAWVQEQTQRGISLTDGKIVKEKNGA